MCLSPDANIFIFQKRWVLIQWCVWPEKYQSWCCWIATAIFLQQLGGAAEPDSLPGPILEFSPQSFAVKEYKEIKRMKINQTKKKDLTPHKRLERLILKQFCKKIRSKPNKIACNLRTQKSNNYTRDYTKDYALSLTLFTQLCSQSVIMTVMNRKIDWSLQNLLEEEGKKNPTHKPKTKQ